MNGVLLKAVLFGSVRLFRAAGRLSAPLQVLGAAGLVLVALTHIFEGLHLFPATGWGSEHSAGHYLDLAGAICGFTLFPLGYLLHTLRRGKR